MTRRGHGSLWAISRHAPASLCLGPAPEILAKKIVSMLSWLQRILQRLGQAVKGGSLGTGTDNRQRKLQFLVVPKTDGALLITNLFTCKGAEAQRSGACREETQS